MINNAVILRHDVKGTPNAAGQSAMTLGQATQTECFVGEVSRRWRFELGATIEEASCQLTVSVDLLDPPPATGDQLFFQLDEESGPRPPLTVLAAKTNRKPGGLSHHVVFLMEVA